MKTFKENLGVKVIHVNAEDKFLKDLEGLLTPKKKGKLLVANFVDIFQEESKEYADVKWLAQGTIYPDVIESAGGDTKKAHNIKSHHNVGGLPDTLKIKITRASKRSF